MIIRFFFTLLPLMLACYSLFSSNALAIQEVSPASLETLTIQEGGRKKPYLVFSEEMLRTLSGKTSLTLDGSTQTAMSIVTGFWMDPKTTLPAWKECNLILVSNKPLKELLGLHDWAERWAKRKP